LKGLVESPHLGPWIARCLVAAGVVSILELGCVLAILPAAGADPIGLALYFPHLLAIHLLAALLLAAVGARLEPLARRLKWPDPARLTAVFLGAVLAVFSLDAFHSFALQGQHRQFPERLQLLELFGLAAVILSCFCTTRFLLRPLLSRLFARLPHLSRPRVVPIAATGFGALATIWVACFGLHPLHLDALAGPAGVIALALVLAAVRWIWPRVPRRTVGVSLILLPALFLVVPLVSWPNPHARFVLYGHTPMAGSLARHLRNLADLDGDGSSSSWLGGRDCRELDPEVGPARREIPGDGIDQDCRGGDARRSAPRQHLDATPPSCALPEGARGLLLITIDAWPADHLDGKITPRAFDLARSSTTFTRAYAPATMTDKVLPCLLGGDILSSIGAPNMVADSAHCIGPPLPARLGRHGIRTGFINPLGSAEATRQGFDEENPSATMRDPLTVNIGSAFLSAATTDDGLAFISRHRDERFFLWVHYLDPHAPYRDPYGFDPGASELDAHERRLHHADSQLGRLLDGVAEMGLSGSTVIAVTADHGEALGRRGREGHGPDAFEEIARVPLVVWVPGCPASVVERPVSTMQIGATFGALTGAAMPGKGLFDATEEGDLPVVTEALFDGGRFALGAFRRAIVDVRYKLIVDVRDGGKMLFDLSEDPGEEIDVLRSRPNAAKEMEALYQRWLDRPRPAHLEGCQKVATDETGRKIDFDFLTPPALPRSRNRK